MSIFLDTDSSLPLSSNLFIIVEWFIRWKLSAEFLDLIVPEFGAEYSHPSSTLFHGNKNRYLSSTSPAGNPSLNQTNINQNNSNNFNNLSNLNGLKRDLYPESEHQHQHQHQHNVVRDRSHSFDHELYPITTPATNYRMQSNNYNIESSKDYTGDSLRGDDVNYFQQFKEKDHFLGTKGVFGGIFCSYSSHFCFCFRFYFIFIFVTWQSCSIFSIFWRLLRWNSLSIFLFLNFSIFLYIGQEYSHLFHFILIFLWLVDNFFSLLILHFVQNTMKSILNL